MFFFLGLSLVRQLLILTLGEFVDYLVETPS
jgi:hypothetical protein